ncbi:MAG: Maf family protein [Brevinematia bacterium]
MNRIILASQSVGRKMLFEEYFREFIIYPSNIDEEIEASNPARLVVELSIKKAEHVSNIFLDDFVFGFDTVVVCKGRIIGKPSTREESIEYLKFLSGKIQSVYSGYCIINLHKKIKKYGYSKTLLMFSKLSDEWIENYISNNATNLFAGGYAIQENDKFIKIIYGDRDTIIGAPMKKILKILGAMDKDLFRNESLYNLRKNF